MLNKQRQSLWRGRKPRVRARVLIREKVRQKRNEPLAEKEEEEAMGPNHQMILPMKQSGVRLTLLL
jgi:hypothetical protein